MLHRKNLIQLFVAILFLLIPLGVVTAQGPTPHGARGGLLTATTFTYQGQLKSSGAPVNGTCDFQFSLWDSISGGTLIAGTITQTVPSVPVSNGLFTTLIDFGTSAFTGNLPFLQIAVGCPSPATTFTPLTSRQALTPTPMALTLPGLYTQWNGTSPNLIGGYNGNIISPTVVGGTIGGGGTSAYENKVWANYATIGGGQNNTASGVISTIGGGQTNTASGQWATVGGGAWNIASGGVATVGGGYGNVATSDGATVGGGTNNIANGLDATVPGGYSDTASGTNSFAAGTYAKAYHQGTFVWADTSGYTDWVSTADDQFLIRARGGVGINTTVPNAALDVDGTLRLDKNDLYLREGTDTNHGLGYYGVGKLFAGTDVDGPVLYGFSGGVLATNQFGVQRIALRWTPAGNVGIGALASAGSINLCLNGSNQLASCSSSQRYKNNIANLNLGLDAIAKLRPVTFNWKDTGQADLGFVAEEVNQVTPLLTTLNQDGQIEGVKYDRLTAVLVKGMQEEQQQIAELKAQNVSLEARVAALEQIAQVNTTGAHFDNTVNIALIVIGVLLGIVVRQKPWQRGG